MAAYTGLKQIAFRGSDVWHPEEKAVLSWIVHRVKDDRMLAAVECLREYYKWNADPMSYMVPAGYGFEPYQPVPPVGIATLFGFRPKPPELNRQDAFEWLRDVVLNTVVGSGFGSLVSYTSNAPNGVGFPAYGQALAFKKKLGDGGFSSFAGEVIESERVREYVYGGEPALTLFLLDGSRDLRTATVKQGFPHLHREMANIYQKWAQEFANYEAMPSKELLEKVLQLKKDYRGLIRNFVSTSSGAVMIVTLAFDIILEGILDFVGQGKLGQQLEDASAAAQEKPVPDIVHLLGYKELLSNTQIVPTHLISR